MSKTDENYGLLVKTKRKEMGLTLVELAEKVGTTHSYLSLLERGLKSNPSHALTVLMNEVLQLGGDTKKKTIDPEEALQNIGPNLKALRKHKRLTLVELSRKIEISNPYLSQLETGKHQNVSITTALKISNFFEVTLEELLSKKISFERSSTQKEV